MVKRPVSVTARVMGWGLVLALTLIVIAPVIVVAWQAGVSTDIRPEDIAAIRFTVTQAILSALVSVIVALPIARALARRQFWGRNAIITLLGAPFILPVIVAVIALLTIFGQGGILARYLAEIGFNLPSIYGLSGVVLAHVFLNVPLVTRYLLQGWNDIPAEHFRLAASLGFSARDTFRLLELPMLRATLPAAALAVFLICTTSFAVALTMGGGPRATTIELAIFQAFRFDFDLARASQLALFQLLLTGVTALVAFRVLRLASFGGGSGRPLSRPDIPKSGGLVVLDATVVAVAVVFFMAPLLSIVVRGAPHLPDLPSSIWLASLNSLLVALAAALMAVLGALGVVLAAAYGATVAGTTLRILAYLPLALSPLVLGTGLFLAINPYIDPRDVALPVAATVNAAVTLPFAVGILHPVLLRTESQYANLADSVGLTGWSRFRDLYFPASRPALGFSAGLAAALSIGDLSVIALFTGADVTTLPMQVYRLMGAYRMEDAVAASLWLLLLSLFVFWVFDWWGRRDA
ncbi:MAG: ABC transporter permease subunit [Rhodobacteraceae bacterium]|nr:ABC transporter permease subunit [Paracoccaceae bacterium]